MAKQSYVGNLGPSQFRAPLNALTTVQREGLILFNGRLSDVFTVSGGPVEITSMLMQITETVSSSALNMAWMSDPDVGVLKIIGDDLDINGFVAGEWVFAELDGTALIGAQTTALPAQAVDRKTTLGGGQIVSPGGIDIRLDDETLQAGRGRMWIEYRPLIQGATIWPGVIQSTTTSSSSTTTTTSTTSTTSSTSSSTSSTASTTSTSTSTSTSSSTTTTSP